MYRNKKTGIIGIIITIIILILVVILSNIDIKYYAYPFGNRNDEYISALKDNDYRLAFTFGPYEFATKSSSNYEIPRIGLFESTPDWKFRLKMFLKK